MIPISFAARRYRIPFNFHFQLISLEAALVLALACINGAIFGQHGKWYGLTRPTVFLSALYSIQSQTSVNNFGGLNIYKNIKVPCYHTTVSIDLQRTKECMR